MPRRATNLEFGADLKRPTLDLNGLTVFVHEVKTQAMPTIRLIPRDAN